MIEENLHEENSTEKDKYNAAFEKFQILKDNEEALKNAQNIIDEGFKKNYTADTLKKIHGCIDLTSLTSMDSKESIWNLVNKVNDYEGKRPDVPSVAAICTYPIFINVVKQALTAENVQIAAVTGGFPSGQTFTEVKIAETAMAVMEGADEIDTVLNLGNFIEESYEEISDEINEIKESCRDTKLKVILETGALATVENIQKAAILAIFSGADFIKTSTGKGYPGATFEAVYAMCKIIKQYHAITGKKIGIKISGGVRTSEDAVKYWTLVESILGSEWMNKDCFRIGASGLLNDIEARLGE